MSATCWRRVQPFTRSVGRLLDRWRKYLRQERQVKCNETRCRENLVRDEVAPPGIAPFDPKPTGFLVKACSRAVSQFVHAGAQGSLGVFLKVECATIPSSCKNTAAPASKHRQKSARSRAISPIYTGVVIGSWRSFQRWERPPMNLLRWPIK